MRTIIDLPSEQVRALRQLCEQEKISRAEAIRRAVDRLIQERSAPVGDAAFGIWKHKRLKARRWVEKLRSEWERP